MYSGHGTMAGWGHTEPREIFDNRPVVMSSQLREVELPIQDKVTCSGNHGDIFLEESTFCAGTQQYVQYSNIPQKTEKQL